MRRMVVLFFGAFVLTTALLALALRADPAEAAQPVMLSPATFRSDAPTERWYVANPSRDEDLLLSVFHELRRVGARKIVCSLPDLLVCDVPVDVDLRAVARASGLTAAPAHDAALLSDPRFARPAIRPATIERARAQRDRFAKLAGGFAAAPGSAVVPLETESRDIPIEAMYESARRAASGDSEFRLIHQNSEIMAGAILIQLVLPESDYPEGWLQYQNWSTEQLNDLAVGMFFVVGDLQDQFVNANIDVVIRWYKGVLVKTEPINLASNKDKFWIALTMSKLGYNSDESTVLNNVHQFNESARIRSGVDWVFTGFIANSETDADHYFLDARNIAWEYVGGPYFVTSYPAGHLDGPDGFAQVVKHEIGHMFWGVEEDVTPVTTCDTRSGYLDIQNLNKVVAYSEYGGRQGCGGRDPQSCVMNELDQYAFFHDGSACPSTAAVFGLSDENENLVPDALDSPPVIEFAAADVETVLAPPDYLDVHVRAVAVPNRNPRQPPELRRDYAARIQDISVRVGGVPPYTIIPSQIGSDGYEADFEVDLPPLLPGTLDIEVQARNQYNAISDTRTKSYLYVHLKYVSFSIHHPNDGIEVSWQLLGDTFDANLRLYRTELATGDTVIIAEGVPPSGPTVKGLTQYVVLDRTAKIGDRYAYHVSGTIDLPHRDTVLHKVVESGAINAQGAVPRIHDPTSPISNAAPNPFTDKTWISVTIPEVDTPTPGTVQPTPASDPSTLVRIVVYDVLGRRVTELMHRYVIASAVTVSWDGTNESGQPMPSGVYFVRAEVGTMGEVRKILMVR